MSSNNDDNLQYKSNKPYSLGLGMYLFEVAFELTFAIPLDEQSKQIYGESDARDLQLTVMGKRWGGEAFLQRYSGFYVVDPNLSVPANTPHKQRPDIVSRSAGINVNYTFNYNKFSFRSAYNFSERQLTSAGSLIAYASLDNVSIEGDSAIVGSKYQDAFGEASEIVDARSTVFAIAPGYTYSLIHKGFFLNGALAIGPANNFVNYSTEDGASDKQFNVNAFIAARLSIGYNGDRIFGGLSFLNIGRNAKFENLELTSSNSSFKILVGYRFLEFGTLRKRAVDIPRELMN